MSSSPSRNKLPVLFIGHGSPMNAIEQNDFTATLRDLASTMPKPTAVCVVSAHWVTRGTEVLAAKQPQTIHDFYGFPKPLFEVQYPAPGAPEIASELATQIKAVPETPWGLDHGAWSVLRHMYPQADVPVFQVSLDQGKTLQEHLELGRELQSLRERGVLIIGSGNLVHNLRRMNWEMRDSAFPWATEFDTRVKDTLDSGDFNHLAKPDYWGEKLLGAAHPTLEHYVPILYCASAAGKQPEISYPYEKMEYGCISMRMVRFATQ